MTTVNKTKYQTEIANGLQSIIVQSPDQWRRYDLLIKMKDGIGEAQMKLTKDGVDELINALKLFKKQLI